MFIKICNDFINLDNVSFISVKFIKHENRESGENFEYYDKNEFVHYLYEHDSYNIYLVFNIINDIHKEYKISLDHIYKNSFDKLKKCNAGMCDVEEHNKYCDALLSLVTSEEDITYKIIKEINKYKSSNINNVIDLESSILTFYKNLIDD